jgi:HK97 family phage major capsid protein/HK97 family phage prohead protease
MFQRAYSVLTVKAVDDGAREIRGVATTPTPDRMGDIVEPLGVKFANPLPLLLHHDSEKPVGTVEFDKPTKNGITFKAKLAKVSDPGVLKDRVDEAWQSLKAGLIRGVSIGFRSLEHSLLKETGGLRFVQTEVMELSLVTIPANADATIQTIKSFDRPASGLVPKSPGVTGTPNQPPKGGFFMPGAKQMKSVKELREFRATKAARLGELAELLRQDGHEATDEETGEFDSLTSEVKSLDNDIRLQSYAEMTAKPVDGMGTKSGSASRGGVVFARNADPEDKFKGQSFTRIQICKALAYARGENPLAIAQERFGKSSPKLVEFMRAAVAGGGTGSGEWGAELAASDARFTGDFIEFLYARTVFDQLNLRGIPARVSVKGQDGAFTGYWVGESKAIPMSKGDYSTVELTPLKVAGLTVISMELLEDSSPSAEMLVRDGLVEASSQRVDQTFLSATAASAGVSPAGILNGVSAIQASGTDLAATRTDLQTLLYPFVQNKMATGITLVMNPATAMALSFMYGSLDQRAYPDINQNGGVLNGLPVVVGDNVTPGQIIAIRTQDVWRIGDSGIRISMSREATIEQQDDPTGATDTPTGVTTTNLTSMFQEESIAFKVVRRINFQKRRSTAVQYIDNAEYGGVVS